MKNLFAATEIAVLSFFLLFNGAVAQKFRNPLPAGCALSNRTILSNPTGGDIAWGGQSDAKQRGGSQTAGTKIPGIS